jgi:hypothetical protein
VYAVQSSESMKINLGHITTRPHHSPRIVPDISLSAEITLEF